MTTHPLIATVQQMYAAFGRGDIPAILAELADDVQWEYDTPPNPVPWFQHRVGREQVVAFFQSLAALEITRFEPRHFFVEGSMVLVVLAFEGRVKATGKTIVEPENIHIWHFNPDTGKVARFRHRANTWMHAQALQA